MKTTILRHRMVTSGDMVVAAVSGGADSTLLLHGLARLSGGMNFRLVVATLDHGLRPSSAEDVHWVRAQCAALAVPCHAGRLRLSQGPGKEARARDARMRFLESVRRAHGAQVVALGHNRSDRMETMLLHLHRGAGLRGLAAMGPVDDKRIRPLIEVDRDSIRLALKRSGISWREDESNTDTDLLRNRVRHRAVPVLRDIFGHHNIEKVWSGLGDRVRMELNACRQLMDRELSRVVLVHRDGVQIPVDWWRALDDGVATAAVMRLVEWVLGSTHRLNEQIIRDLVQFFRAPGKGEWRPFRRGAPLLVRSGAWSYLLERIPHVDVTVTGPGRYTGWFRDLVVTDEWASAPHDAVGVEIERHPFPWKWGPVNARTAVWADDRRPSSPMGVMKHHRWGWFEREFGPVLHRDGAVLWIPGDVSGNSGRAREAGVAVYTVPAIGYNPRKSP